MSNELKVGEYLLTKISVYKVLTQDKLKVIKDFEEPNCTGTVRTFAPRFHFNIKARGNILKILYE